GDAVDLDVATVAEHDTGLLQAQARGARHAADGDEAVGGGDDAAVGELDLDAVPDAADGGGAGAGQDGHAAAAEDVLDELGGVLVLPGQHPVAAGDEGDGHAEAVVGAGELGAGDAGADDDEVLGQLGEVVHLRPGEDALAVRLRVRQDAGGGARGDEDDLGDELDLLAVGGRHVDGPGAGAAEVAGQPDRKSV